MFLREKEAREAGKAVSMSAEYLRRYKENEKLNFTAIFASKLANLAVSEANAEVISNGGTSEFNTVFSEIWRDAKNITAASLGVGGVFLIPYFSNGEIHTDTITQDRVLIEKTRGGRIVEATVLAETVRKNGRSFARWTHYSLEKGEFVISNMATCGGEVVPLSCVREWEEISPEIRIPNSDRMLFAYLKSPMDSRDLQSPYGVPITYGCEGIISEIYEHLEAIKKEYRTKQAFIGADAMLFSADGKLPEDGIFKMLSPLGSERDFWQEFNPEIRFEPYFKRLEQLYATLESAVGTNRGVITEINSANATATEIKRARYDTFAIVEAIRRSWEYAAADLMYSYKKIAEHFLKATAGNMYVSFDWAYLLSESSDESFDQLMRGYEAGVVSAAELRQFLKPAESLKLAEEKIKKIRQEEKHD